jgi:hypothetical protein
LAGVKIIPVAKTMGHSTRCCRPCRSRHPDYFQFSEQFANSPYFDRVDAQTIERLFKPVGDLIRQGIRRKIIKDMEVDIISAFVFYPVLILANPRLCRNFDMTPEQIDRAFQLAWDAIKL